ncbi:hypothetical protein [Bradyrhizobium diazoefficiens]
MQNDAAVRVAQCLQEADLLALQSDQPAEGEIDQERGYQKEDRRQRAAHVVEHVEFMIEPGVRGLVLPPVGRLAAVGIEQGIQLQDDLALGGAGLQLDRNCRKGAVEIVDACERLLRHPDDGEAAVVRHQVARADRVDELGGQGRADDDELTLLAVQNGRESRPFGEPMRSRERLVNDDLLCPPRLRKPSGTDVQPIEVRLGVVR